ncbi:MAG: site-specific DNA-methyltransferase [Thermoplasmata archaeon]|nr:site-specific DNA-methyltransferase [Thermoplasmata archaeon]
MPLKLNENEIRDIAKYLAEGKPLPEKYRFLLFEDKREVELVWNGKTNEVTNVVMPFQTIEVVDEPRKEIVEGQAKLFDFGIDERGRQLKGWTNKLIWGDNKLILSSLLNGPMREEIKKQGGIKLIYIDPPFDVGADFSMNVEIGNERFTKAANILEELAFRDTWGKGADSFISMIYERLSLLHDLLAEDGSIYVHCDWRVNSYIRLVLDEIFGNDNLVNEISWRRANSKTPSNKLAVIHDTILYYCKSKKYIFNTQYHAYKEGYVESRYPHVDENGRYYTLQAMYGKGPGPARKFGDRVIQPPPGSHWRWTQERIDEAMKDGIIVFPRDGDGKPRFKDYLDTKNGIPLQTIWNDIPDVNSQAKERADYPTQKPEALLERIIKASSNENDIVADFFCGSGTTLAVAEKLGRKWIGADLGKFAIHTTRKRLLDIQRQKKEKGKDYRAFEILNLGKYERQHYIGINPNLRDEEKKKQLEEKEQKFVELILHAYRAAKTDGFKTFHGKKNNRLVAIGPINLPVTRLFVEEVILECREKHITKVDILGFEFEMGLFPNIQEEAKNKGIDLALKYIPREVFDKRAVEKNQVVFHVVSYIELRPHFKDNSVAVELTDFSVFYNQDTLANAESTLKNGATKIVVENGKIIKVKKDGSGIVSKELLTQKWTDWIDYWAVDFNYESKREIVRVWKDEKYEMDGTLKSIEKEREYEEVWTGDYVFENEWQSFRTKRNKEIDLKSIFKDCKPGRRKIAVKVVDIFGNDTMKIIEVTVGGKK